jgi:hypothetical protein
MPNDRQKERDTVIRNAQYLEHTRARTIARSLPLALLAALVVASGCGGSDTPYEKKASNAGALNKGTGGKKATAGAPGQAGMVAGGAVAAGGLVAPTGGSTVADVAGNTGCVVGTLRCPCYGNNTCNAGLVCASQICVDLGSGGSGQGGNAASGATFVLTGGASAVNGGNGQGGAAAGSPNAFGGNVVVGGAAPAGGNGASGAAAGASGNLGQAGIAGAGAVAGGIVGAGGTDATAGMPAVGGSFATGGIAATGGSFATGGIPATGGSFATGGIAATGGSFATGGIPATGGSFATGGMPGTAGSSTGTQSVIKFCNSLEKGGADIVLYLATTSGPSLRLTALTGTCSSCVSVPDGALALEMGEDETGNWITRFTWTPSTVGAHYYLMATIDTTVTPNQPTTMIYKITASGETCSSYDPF